MEQQESAIETLTGWGVKAVAQWSALTAVGGFLVYLFGYLSLRAHLAAIGLAVDLGTLDERYFFAGAQFLVNLGFATFFSLVILLPATDLVDRGLRRALPRHRLVVWLVPAWIVATLSIHLVPFGGKPSWLGKMIIDGDNLVGLLYAVQITLALRVCFAAFDARHPVAAIMAVVVVMLVPMNHGIMMAPYMAFPACLALDAGVGGPAWLIHDGKAFVHYLTLPEEGPVIVSVKADSVARHRLGRAVPLLPLLTSASTAGRLDHGFCGVPPAKAILEVPPAGARDNLPKPPNDPKPLWARLLGAVALGPVQIQSSGRDAAGGEVWESEGTGELRRLTTQGGYLWPVVRPSGAVYAMREPNLVVRLGKDGHVGACKPLAGLKRLVGFDAEEPSVLVWSDGGGGNLGALDVDTCRVTRLEAPGAVRDWLPAALASEHRKTAAGDLRPVARGGGSDLYLGGRRIADCGGDACGQVSPSADGKRFVFVRSRLASASPTVQ